MVKKIESQSKAEPSKSEKKVSEKLKVIHTAGDRKRRQLSRRFAKLKVTKDSTRGVIYIGHLPKGFNENELKQFF